MVTNIKDFDIFGISAEWNLFRKKKYQTLTGGIISILFIIFIIYKIFRLLIEFFSNSDHKISYLKQELPQKHPIKFQNFEIAFCLYNPENSTFVNIFDEMEIDSNFFYHDYINREKSSNKIFKIQKCKDAKNNSTFYENFENTKKYLSIIEKCYCSFADKEFPIIPESQIALRKDRLEIERDYLTYSVKSIKENQDLSNLNLRLFAREYKILDSSEINLDKLHEMSLQENINSFDVILEEDYFTQKSFYIDSVDLLHKTNFDVFNYVDIIGQEFSISEKDANFRKKKTNEKKSILSEIAFYSSGKKINYSFHLLGLEDIYSKIVGFIFYFLILNFFLGIYNRWKFNKHVDKIIEKNYNSSKVEEKKLTNLFRMNFLAELEKENDYPQNQNQNVVHTNTQNNNTENFVLKNIQENEEIIFKEKKYSTTKKNLAKDFEKVEKKETEENLKIEQIEEKKYSGIDRKVYDLGQVKNSEERYDIRKNFRDIFSIRKNRNKIIKDFWFNRLIDVEVYINFILEFYKFQKILINKDLLLLFKKTFHNSLFNDNTFSYFQFCVNNNNKSDNKFKQDHDRNNLFNNHFYQCLQADYFQSKKMT